VYLLVTMGVTVAIHFCGDSITSVHMLPFQQDDSSCGCDDSAAPDDCCKTEIKSFQLNNEQIAAQGIQLSCPQTDFNVWAQSSCEQLFSSNSIQTVLPAFSPPDSPQPYILHCTLLI